MPRLTGNTFMMWFIRSPFHFLLGSNFGVITVTGRRTGKPISTPVNVFHGEQGYTVISTRERTWWRNLRENRSAQLHVGGKTHAVEGTLLEGIDEVKAGLERFFTNNPRMIKYFGIRAKSAGQVEQADLQRAAEKNIILWLSPVL